ncbi:hypothetical protein ACTQ3Z_10995 [Lawsonibacter sp. LCP25S3_F5]
MAEQNGTPQSPDSVITTQRDGQTSGKSRETGTAAEKTVHFEEAGRIQETGGAAAER